MANYMVELSELLYFIQYSLSPKGLQEKKCDVYNSCVLRRQRYDLIWRHSGVGVFAQPTIHCALVGRLCIH